jgi:uncharacterized protein YndB with AHSA1/START domain
MATDLLEQEDVHTFFVRKEIDIAAPPDITYEAVLDQLGPQSQMPDGRPFPMKLEPWPGGRWYRDLGKNTGHLWGHVQVIKPPSLIEIWGPLMMSYPAVNHVQYRLKPEGKGTRLTFTHRAMGLILPEHRDGMPTGWEHWLQKIGEVAERKAAALAKKMG